MQLLNAKFTKYRNLQIEDEFACVLSCVLLFATPWTVAH